MAEGSFGDRGTVTSCYFGMSISDADSRNEGKPIERPSQVTILTGYEYRARAEVGNQRRNVGGFVGERVRQGGNERIRAFGGVVACLSMPLPTEPRVSHRVACGAEAATEIWSRRSDRSVIGGQSPCLTSGCS
jgi:hypothetical protein